MLCVRADMVGCHGSRPLLQLPSDLRVSALCFLDSASPLFLATAVETVAADGAAGSRRIWVRRVCTSACCVCWLTRA